jgi:hypothetical protein
MNRFGPLIVLSFLVIGAPAFAQLSIPSGDFRVEDRPGTAPTVGLPGGPSLAPGPSHFQDPIGAKSSDEILRRLDKDLGRDTVGSPLPLTGGRIPDLPRDPGGASSAGTHPSSVRDAFK